jgi:hypothetical protein
MLRLLMLVISLLMIVPQLFLTASATIALLTSWSTWHTRQASQSLNLHCECPASGSRCLEALYRELGICCVRDRAYLREAPLAAGKLCFPGKTGGKVTPLEGTRLHLDDDPAEGGTWGEYLLLSSMFSFEVNGTYVTGSDGWEGGFLGRPWPLRTRRCRTDFGTQQMVKPYSTDTASVSGAGPRRFNARTNSLCGISRVRSFWHHTTWYAVGPAQLGFAVQLQYSNQYYNKQFLSCLVN